MKKLSILLAFVITPLIGLFSQGFYDINTINTIEITFEESNWDYLLDKLVSEGQEERLLGSVTVNGMAFDSVGIRYKGNSSYRSNQVKNPLNIKLDHVIDNQLIEGYGTLKLANVFKDPSFVREVLSYEIARKYFPASQANYANVYINGTHLGLYTSDQSVDKFFMRTHFASDENTRAKGEITTNGPPSGGVWEYYGLDSTNYYAYYDMKSDYGWEELINFFDTLSNHNESIDQILNIDRHLWFLAFSNLLVNLDGPINNPQNHYLYKDMGRFNPIPWDLNECFGVFSSHQTLGNLNTSSLQRFSPYANLNESNFPIISKILTNETYKKIYVAHMKTIIEENFENDQYVTRALEIQDIISNDVQADNNKFYSYNNFTGNINNSVGGGPNATIGIAQLMNTRTDYLLGLTDFKYESPIISSVNYSMVEVNSNTEIRFTSEVSNVVDVYLGYRNNSFGTFEKVLMYDDGNHDDGQAGDGVYGASIIAGSTDIQYYIYAENNDAVSFSPVRAEYEFYEISLSGDLVINEFMASNDTTAADQDGEYDDWIELYNNGSSSIDLEGYFLSDDANDLTQWTFPAGTVIESNDYLIIWADKDEDQDGLHANFKLSASAESVVLVDASGINIIDQVSYANQNTDISYSRIPNGTGEFQTTVPTFNSNNDGLPDCLDKGGDTDNDGICADDDCDDNDANIGARKDEGSPCDDGNASTENDVILSDGCTCVGTPIMMTDLVINEFMADNDSIVADQDDEYDDWIELYNNGTSNIDLGGYFLSDDENDLTQWTFPENTVIEPDGYLIIWADNDEEQEGLHANFKLSASGESVILINPTDTTIVDAISYSDQTTDISYARIPNGTGDFQLSVPTFNANNDSNSDCLDKGGDADNDGICADDDCDDTNPSIGERQEPGTQCDDGDVTTENDVILSDSCTCAGTTIILTDLVINEFMASNDSTITDQDGEYDDWIELYNNGNSKIYLEGFFMTDDSSDLSQWVFPADAVIEPNGYLIIWADKNEDQTGLHANFKLSSSGESILLINPSDNSIIDGVNYLEQITDISYGRFPNGTGSFQLMNPTFNAENNDSSLDLDGDGYPEDVDCDDNNADINPGATEIPYNGIDDDCDEATLDDDLDQDGFLLVDDCDDTNPDINPDAIEIPDNGIDEDCDGEDSTTSIHELANSKVTIFPNPVSSILKIDIDGDLEYEVRVYDLNGVLIQKQQNQNLISVHKYENGMYILEIFDLNSNESIKERIVVIK